jgi:hypothetical protein
MSGRPAFICVPPATTSELAKIALVLVCLDHSFRSASLNAMVRSTFPVESRTRIAPERNLASKNVLQELFITVNNLAPLCIQNPIIAMGHLIIERVLRSWVVGL